jgi:hypothetical protein
MTADELAVEFAYRRDERLGMLCGDKVPTHDQTTEACLEAKLITLALRFAPKQPELVA